MNCRQVRWIAVFLYFLIPYSLFCIEQGAVVVMYGTPCSGKSTLAKALKKNFKGKFKIAKKTSLVEEKKRTFILEVTGKTAVTREDILRETLSLPDTYKEEARSFFKIGINEKIEEIKERVLKGENIIFDVCLKSPYQVQNLQGTHVVYVFVHASLPILSEREIDRTKSKCQGPILQQQRRQAILTLFSTLYKPSEDHPPSSKFIITKQQLDDYLSVTKDLPEHKELQTAYSRLLEAFHLNSKMSETISPTLQPDILIDTEQESTEESVSRIRNYLETKGFIKPKPVKKIWVKPLKPPKPPKPAKKKRQCAEKAA